MSKVVEKVTSTDNAIVRFNGTTGDVQNSGVIIDDNGNITSLSNKYISFGGTSNSYFYADSAGSTEIYGGNNIRLVTAGAERVRIDSNGNVGIGVTPSASTDTGNITIGGGKTINFATYQGQIAANATYNSGWKYLMTGLASKYAMSNGAHYWQTAPSGTAGNAITWTDAMTLDTNGNVGIGVTPSAWASNVKSVELNNAFISSGAGWSGAANAVFGNNFYLDTSSAERYKSSGLVHKYQQGVNGHQWFTAPSGTAGNAITWTNAMILNNNGNLLIGTSTDDGVNKLQVNGNSNIYGLNTALQYKRTSNYHSGMSGYFGDKIEYAIRTLTSSRTKTFRVTNNSPSNNENFGLFFKARWVIYSQTPCMGSYEYCVGFMQPGSGATCVFVNANSGNAIGSTSPLSVSSTAVNSASFDVTITVNSIYTNVVLELEAIYTAGLCTITPQ